MPPERTELRPSLDDRLATAELLDRYPFLVDQGRYDELAGLFTSDGVVEGPVGEPGHGREGITEFFRAAARVVEGPLPRLMRHHVTSRAIELDGDEGKASSYFVAFSETGPDHWGRYRDQLRKVDGSWLLRSRVFSVDGYVAGSWWERNLAAVRG